MCTLCRSGCAYLACRYFLGLFFLLLLLFFSFLARSLRHLDIQGRAFFSLSRARVINVGISKELVHTWASVDARVEILIRDDVIYPPS